MNLPGGYFADFIRCFGSESVSSNSDTQSRFHHVYVHISSRGQGHYTVIILVTYEHDIWKQVQHFTHVTILIQLAFIIGGGAIIYMRTTLANFLLTLLSHDLAKIGNFSLETFCNRYRTCAKVWKQLIFQDFAASASWLEISI